MNMRGVTPKTGGRRADWIWFAYSAFFFIAPILEPSRWIWAASIATFLVFTGVFALYVHTGSSVLRNWMIAATLLLGVVSFPWNPGASTFFIYTAAFIPFSVTSAWASLSLFGLEALIITGEHYYAHVSWANGLLAIFMLLIVGGSNIFIANQRRADCKLRLAHEEIEALAAMAERERIARDLHDVLGHTLSVIVLKAELAKRLMEADPERAASEIADVERTARSALAEVREAIGGYRARGLAAEIEVARRALDAAGVTLVAEAAPTTAAGLTAAEETVLALAVREAVTNIVRHAQAKTCRLRFVTAQGHRRLQVEDDGQHPLEREGNGLRGMRERVEALGGSVTLDRSCGTRLSIELPLRAEGAA